MKARWRCLLSERALRYDPIMARKIINACAILHNIAIDARLPDPDPITEEEAQEERRREAGDHAANPVNINRDFLGHAQAVRHQVVNRLWQQRH